MEVVWMKAHLSYETALNLGYNHYWWIGNYYAGRLADRAALQHAPNQTFVTSFREQLDHTRQALEHHIAIASHLAPKGGKPTLARQVDQPHLSKLDRARQLAKEAGHHLGPDESCIACGLVVPVQRNLVSLIYVAWEV